MSKTRVVKEPKQTYYFRRLDNGRVFRRRMTHSQIMGLDVLRRITLRGGAEAVLLGSERFVALTSVGPSRKPRGAFHSKIRSAALSVRPSQAAKFNEQARRAGLTSVYYDQKGICTIGSERDQARLLDLRHPTEPIVNRDGVRSRKNF